MSPARSLLAPRRLAAHLLVLTVVAALVSLGFWQVDRLGQVRATNQRLEERLAAPVLDFAEIADAGPDAAAELEYRQVEVTGTFVTSDEVLLRSRANRERNGFHVVTPLQTAPGQAVVINRGWVPIELDTPGGSEFTPPEGEVTVRGVLRRTVDQPGFGAKDPPTGRLERMFHADVSRIGQQTGDALFAMIIDLEEPQPAAGGLPIPLERPSFEEGSHLSYAFQWFAFALIALVTYASFVGKRLREETDGDQPPSGEPTREELSRAG